MVQAISRHRTEWVRAARRPDKGRLPVPRRAAAEPATIRPDDRVGSAGPGRAVSAFGTAIWVSATTGKVVEAAEFRDVITQTRSSSWLERESTFDSQEIGAGTLTGLCQMPPARTGSLRRWLFLISAA